MERLHAKKNNQIFDNALVQVIANVICALLGV
jgi:hypothetical protein